MEEYIELRRKIIRTLGSGIEHTTLISKSDNLSKHFKDMLWFDYGIDIDNIEEE